MYAAISCRSCSRYRIIDKTSASSKCPYCGADVKHRDLAILFEHIDQSIVRDAITQMTFVPEVTVKKKGDDPDPISTLIYQYERCRDIDEKMGILSAGLTKIYGTFTLKDIESVDQKNAERMLKAMLELCLIHEVEHGIYRG